MLKVGPLLFKLCCKQMIILSKNVLNFVQNEQIITLVLLLARVNSQSSRLFNCTNCRLLSIFSPIKEISQLWRLVLVNWKVGQGNTERRWLWMPSFLPICVNLLHASSHSQTIQAFGGAIFIHRHFCFCWFRLFMCLHLLLLILIILVVAKSCSLSYKLSKGII